MYYSLSKDDPYMIDLPEPIHVREIVWEVVSDIQRRHKAQTVTLDGLKAQIRERRIYAGVTVGS